MFDKSTTQTSQVLKLVTSAFVRRRLQYTLTSLQSSMSRKQHVKIRSKTSYKLIYNEITQTTRSRSAV